MRFYVYIFREPSGAPYYVGKGCGVRAEDHISAARRGVKSHFYNKLRKELSLGHTPVIERHEGLSEEAAFQMEMDLINQYGRKGVDPGGVLTNILPGGNAPPSQKGKSFQGRKPPSTKGKPGRAWTEEEKAAQRLRMKARMNDPETIDKCKAAKVGKPGNPHTPESRAAIGAAHRGKKSLAKSLSKRGDLNPSRKRALALRGVKP